MPFPNNTNIGLGSNPEHKQARGDRSVDTTESANSTVSQFLRKIIPLEKWNFFFPNVAQDEPKQVPSATAAGEDFDAMLFDVVPFNGDTDNENSFDNAFDRVNNGMDSVIDFEIPIDTRVDSNVSPIGNVSSYAGVKTVDNDSDDDIDRILGTTTHRKGTILDQLNQTLETAPNGSLLSNNDYLNDNSILLIPIGSHPIGSIEEASFSSLGDGDLEDANGKRKVWYKSMYCWMIILCIALVTVLAIMLGTMKIFRKSPSYYTDSEENISNEETTPTMSPTDVIVGGTFPIVETYEESTPSLWKDSTPTVRPTIQVDSTFDDATLGTMPSSSPTQQYRNFWDDDDDVDLASEQSLPQVQLDMGPMVGHTTPNSVTLWAYYRKPAMYLFEDAYVLEIMIFDSDGWVRTIEEATADPDRSNAVFALVEGLQPLTRYKYEMRILGQLVGKGSFRTAPPLPQRSDNSRQQLSSSSVDRQSSREKYAGAKFDYILASCIDRSEYPNQPVWENIALNNGDQYPDFAILAGDTVYMQEHIDVDSFQGVRFDRLWDRNREQRTEPHFAKFLRNTPMYSTWNNHDYGSEWTSVAKDQPGKEVSLEAFRSLWANPGFGQGPSDGVYYSFYWGDVHYIVTDDQWSRDPRWGNRFGTRQTEWIRSELVSSRGTFKVIVVGSDVMERGWSSDLENIGTVVSENSINGVLFHAGDIHRNEYKRLETGGFPYPVTQISSSGIAKVWRRPFVKLSVDTTLADPSITASFYGATSMLEYTTWENDPNLECSSIDGIDRDKEHSCTETIRLSDLSAF